MFEYYLKMVSQFVDDMRKQKLRCFLTMSGITWGTMSVILLLALGESFREVSIKNMTGMGANIVIMGGGRTSLSSEGLPAGRHIRLREETAAFLRASIPGIDLLSPEIQRYMTMNVGGTRQSYNLVGVYPEYGILRNLAPRKGGRFIDRLDMENRRRVVFLGSDISDKFFGKGVNSVGKTLMINGMPFTVIGIMEHKVQNSSYMNRDQSIAFMPFSTCQDVFNVKNIERIIFRARNTDDTPRIQESIRAILGRKFGFLPEDKDAIWMWDTSEGTRFISMFFLGFEAFLFMGGLFTLIVGGIGVANIMYVTIRERRREIGVKSALGATPRMILAQFMLESFLIMLIGGSIGVLGAWFIVTIFSSPALSGIQTVMGKPSIDFTIALVTASLLALIGFAAGWSPARSAADMDPVRALEF